ncbi:hypothetical protein C8R44DRAFT_746955 [Mycena epipterygia]|nr:hypothetical protein C8R44DRAFT_746955 [Mycena epipterygia]
MCPDWDADGSLGQEFQIEYDRQLLTLARALELHGKPAQLDNKIVLSSDTPTVTPVGAALFGYKKIATVKEHKWPIRRDNRVKEPVISGTIVEGFGGIRCYQGKCVVIDMNLAYEGLLEQYARRRFKVFWVAGTAREQRVSRKTMPIMIETGFRGDDLKVFGQEIEHVTRADSAGTHSKSGFYRRCAVIPSRLNFDLLRSERADSAALLWIKWEAVKSGAAEHREQGMESFEGMKLDRPQSLNWAVNLNRFRTVIKYTHVHSCRGS